MHTSLKKPQLERPRNRARRQRSARRDPIKHIALPGYEIARAVPRSRETLSAFLRRVGWAAKDPEYGWQFKNGLPTIVVINGEPILRKYWRSTRIAANDNVQVISKPLGPRGGSGKQVLGLVALVAVSAFALWAGPALATGLGLAGTSATIVGGLGTAAIGLGGALLVNSLTAPKAGATNTADSTSDQIYSVAAQGNTAKLGQPLPFSYGREKAFPDFAATPWSEFVGNDQYLNLLLCTGMGKYSYEQLYVDDTPFWDPVTGISATFTDAEVAFYNPGEPVTLFPTNVTQSVEVTGQTLPDPATTPWIGPFVANPAGTEAQSLIVDFVFPAGCFTVDSNGNLGSSTVTLTAEYAPVDGAGAPTAAFTTLFSITRKYSSRTPIRDSVKTDVADGRYAVRFKRGNAPITGTSGSNDVVWAGLRSYLNGSNTFPDVSLIAIRIKASESTQGSYKFGALRTRILPVWDPSAAGGAGAFVEQPTRSVAWAAYDLVTNTQYGCEFPLSQVDFNAWVALDTGCTARGDRFDYTFNTAINAPDAIDKILAVARAKHYWLGDTISVIRDEWRDVPSMLLTDRETVRGSTQIGWTMLGENDPDAVIVEYVDEDVWTGQQVQYPPNAGDFIATNPTTVRMDGIVNRNHAYREAAFYYNQSIYRRENVQISVEYEGRALTLGSTVRIQNELPMAYGQSGAVLSRSDNLLHLEPAPSWADTGPFFIRIRRPNGIYFGPVTVVRGADDSSGVIDADDLASVESQLGITLDQALAREDGGDPPSFELGTADSQSRVCVLLSGSPNGNTCSLNFVVDDERVHTTDIGTPTILPTAQFPANNTAPVVAFLQAAFRQGVAEPILDATWWPAAGAQYYTAEVSYDAGLGANPPSWIQVYEGVDVKFSVVVDRADIRLRVRAVGQRAGAYSFVDIAAPTIVLGPGIVAPSTLEAGLRDYIDNQLGSALQAIDFINQRIASAAQEQDAANYLDKRVTREILAAQVGDLSASIEETAEIAETIDGKLAAAYFLQVVSGDRVAGMVLYSDGSVSDVAFVADNFLVAGPPGVAGGDPIPVFEISTVGGVAQLALRGNLFADGSISAQALSVTELSAITANVGLLTAGQIQSADGMTVIDLDGGGITGYANV